MLSLWNQQYFVASPKRSNWNQCWNRCEHRYGRVSEIKWEPFYRDINHQSRVIPKQRWKVLSISLKLWTNGSGSEEQCVIMPDLFSVVIGAAHTNFKMFSQWTHMECSQRLPWKQWGEDLLAQNVRLGVLSDFRKLSRIWAASSKTPTEESIF